MGWVFEIFLGSFTALGDAVRGEITAAYEAGLDPSLGSMIGLFILAALWLASACAAATVAECRLRTRLPHFIGGMLCPGVYPAAVFFMLPRGAVPEDPADKAREERRSAIDISKYTGAPSESERKRRLAEREAIQPDDGTDESPLDDGQPEMGMIYFKSIAVDKDGNHRGPFIIELEGGQFLEVAKIINPKPDILICELPSEGGKGRTIRIPYAKVVDCRDADG